LAARLATADLPPCHTYPVTATNASTSFDADAHKYANSYPDSDADTTKHANSYPDSDTSFDADTNKYANCYSDSAAACPSPQPLDSDASSDWR
jgi:hypothetical protein